jgi:hypothetical protein
MLRDTFDIVKVLTERPINPKSPKLPLIILLTDCVKSGVFNHCSDEYWLLVNYYRQWMQGIADETGISKAENILFCLMFVDMEMWPNQHDALSTSTAAELSRETILQYLTKNVDSMKSPDNALRLLNQIELEKWHQHLVDQTILNNVKETLARLTTGKPTKKVVYTTGSRNSIMQTPLYLNDKSKTDRLLKR